MIRVKTLEKFESFLESHKKNKRDFEMYTRNSGRKIVDDPVRNFGWEYKGLLSPEEMKTLWVYSNVRKQVKTRVDKMHKIDFYTGYLLGPQRRNHELYKKLPMGTWFSAIDIKHAYWRMAFIRGYINQKLYDRLKVPQFKFIRNKALACMTSKVKYQRYKEGELVIEYYTGDPVLLEVYDDIRQRTYSVLDEVAEIVGPDFFLKYHTDCVYVKNEVIDQVTDIFKKHDLDFSIARCRCMDSEMFMQYDINNKPQLKHF